jgi:hypothetical protein
VRPALKAWLEAAVALEAELLAAPPLTVGQVDLAAAVLNRQGHLRLIVDLVDGASPRLRVSLIGRNGTFALLDTAGICAPPPAGVRVGGNDEPPGNPHQC